MRHRFSGRAGRSSAARGLPVLTGSWTSAGGAISTTATTGRLRIIFASNATNVIPDPQSGWTALHAGIISLTGTPDGAARVFGRVTAGANETIPSFGGSRQHVLEFSGFDPGYLSDFSGLVTMSNESAASNVEFTRPAFTPPTPMMIMTGIRYNSVTTLDFDAPVSRITDQASAPRMRVGHTTTAVTSLPAQTWAISSSANRIAFCAAIRGALI